MSTAANSLIRILPVDDHVIVRQGLRLLIESNSDMKVVAEAGTCDEALAAASKEIPDLVLLDLDLGSGSGLDIIPQLVALHEKLHVLVLTGVRDPAVQRQQRTCAGNVLSRVRRESPGEFRGSSLPFCPRTRIVRFSSRVCRQRAVSEAFLQRPADGIRRVRAVICRQRGRRGQ